SAGERERSLSTKEAEEVRDRFDEDWAFELSPVELAAGVLSSVPGIVRAHPFTGRGCDSPRFGNLVERRSKISGQALQNRIENLNSPHLTVSCASRRENSVWKSSIHRRQSSSRSCALRGASTGPAIIARTRSRRAGTSSLCRPFVSIVSCR